MKHLLILFLSTICSCAWGDTPDITIPKRDVELIKAADYLEISGTNEAGGPENFTIHNSKAIGQFVELLTSDRYAAVPKNLNPQFKSRSNYDIRLSARGAPLLELHIIAESVLDIPGDASFYMQSDRHSDNLMAPLLRLR